MPTLRQRVGQLVLREEYRELTTQAEAFRMAYEKSPHLMSGNGLLAELDTQSISYLRRHMGYDLIAGFGGPEPKEDDRRREVENARWFHQWDPVTGQAVSLWTDFGFGQMITVTPTDPAAEDDWSEFWKATRNRPLLGARHIHRLSDKLLVDGELFFTIFVNTTDGTSTLRKIDTLEITRKVTDPQDKEKVLYCQRSFNDADGRPVEVYYPDWLATPEELARAKLPTDAKKANEQQEGTDVVVLHVTINELDGRGWPLITRGAPWAKTYWNFLQDRAAVNRKVAMYVDTVKVKGGSRAIDAVKRAVQSSLVNNQSGWETNPPAAAGSDWLENEAVDRKRMPLATGAGDARMDGMTLVSQAGIGYGITSPAYLGRPDAMQNRATARELRLPTIRRWDRYQLFWGSVWRDMVEIVLTMKEKYGGASYEDKGANVNTDAAIQIELDILIKAVIEAANAGMMPDKQAASIVLKRPEFGIENVDELIKKMFPDDGGEDAEDEEEDGDEEEDEATPEETLEEIAAQLRELVGDAMEGDAESATMGIEVIEDLQSVRG